MNNEYNHILSYSYMYHGKQLILKMHTKHIHSAVLSFFSNVKGIFKDVFFYKTIKFIHIHETKHKKDNTGLKYFS